MVHKKLTKRKVDAIIKEEEESAKYYERMGMITFANDERRHANYFKAIRRML